MAIYAIYLMYFLALFFWLRGRNVVLIIDAKDLKYILMGLALFCLITLVSKLLIRLEMKSDTFEIIHPHFLLMAICFFLFYKLKSSDEQDGSV